MADRLQTLMALRRDLDARSMAKNKLPDIPATETERAVRRIQTQRFLVPELETEQYPGSVTATADSSLLRENLGMFGGKAKQQKTPLEMVRESNTLSKENALARLIAGEPLSPTDSLFVKSYLPKPAVPEKPKAYDPSAALADSVAQWQLGAVAGIPGAEEKLKRHAGIKEAMRATTKAAPNEKVSQRDYLNALKSIADLKIKLSVEEEPGAKAALQEALDETMKTHVRYRSQLLSDKYPPSSVTPGTIKQDTISGYYFQSDGTQWKRIIPPQQ